MGASEYHLFRVKLIKPIQHTPLFGEDLTPSQIFVASLHECPKHEINDQNVWHIGNVEWNTDTSGCFAVGRTSIRTTEKFDEETKTFYMEEDESSPFTNILFDAMTGVIAIKKKPLLAADTKTIAKRLRQVLMASSAVKTFSIDVRIDHIPDPDDFIEKVKTSFAITYFRSTFSGPNPKDADELFQKPLSVYCQEFDATNGVISVYGPSLNAETVEAVAHASAASGNEVNARVKQGSGSKPIPISFKGDPTRIVANSDVAVPQLIEKMQEEYNRVRG